MIILKYLTKTQKLLKAPKHLLRLSLTAYQMAKEWNNEDNERGVAVKYADDAIQNVWMKNHNGNWDAFVAYVGQYCGNKSWTDCRDMKVKLREEYLASAAAGNAETLCTLLDVCG